MASDLKEAKQRVRDHLVQPLTRLGLRRASGVTVAQFDATIDELCGRLSYMTAINLDALAEQASRLAGGKDRSLFPSASKILAWAADIQPPEDSASPLLIAVFSGPLGSQAMAEDWAPELRSYVRKERIWPKGIPLVAIKERAKEARRRLELIEEVQGQGRVPNPVDLDMQKKRAAAAEKCALIMRQIEVNK
ncbi:hypothetical protein [Pseudophaeobacter sp.]|jgi:hypothetical protein|uniref:hypothetical protein n=1 Tax=Pseudophaeobacter sp. TaxID=1971739 RepID=UPI00220CACEA|nr:hypothetical protein N1037_08640 [Phaeobacter sp. G2]